MELVAVEVIAPKTTVAAAETAKTPEAAAALETTERLQKLFAQKKVTGKEATRVIFECVASSSSKEDLRVISAVLMNYKSNNLTPTRKRSEDAVAGTLPLEMVTEDDESVPLQFRVAILTKAAELNGTEPPLVKRPRRGSKKASAAPAPVASSASSLGAEQDQGAELGGAEPPPVKRPRQGSKKASAAPTPVTSSASSLGAGQDQGAELNTEQGQTADVEVPVIDLKKSALGRRIVKKRKAAEDSMSGVSARL